MPLRERGVIHSLLAALSSETDPLAVAGAVLRPGRGEGGLIPQRALPPSTRVRPATAVGS